MEIFSKDREVDAKTAFICKKPYYIELHKHTGKEPAQADYDDTCKHCRKQK